MDVVGSEIGQKMRSAIKAKLTELGCYVDDELPDYVMVMVANKRTRTQMEDDLQLFLGDNTELFVNWLHQVLKKLQEVTVTAPLKPESEKSKEKSKEKKAKDKKDKEKSKAKKSELLKKGKKKHKDKTHRKKDEKKIHKSKKKSKHHEMIHPNVPPLLMNMEKESEPSITDVFAGQILKKHGVTIDSPKKEEIVDVKPVIKEIKRPILPIIDPATIPSQSEPESCSKAIETSANESGTKVHEVGTKSSETSTEASEASTLANEPSEAEVQGAPREEQIKEINEIEAKIQGLKQKLAEQLDSMSDDEDFLTIRTEAEELMNDFAEDVFQEISSQTPAVTTPPLQSRRSPSPSPPRPLEIPKEIPKEPQEPEELPHIELKLPKRPIRERLGAREEPKKTAEKKTKEVPERKAQEEQKKAESPERFTPEREPDFWAKSKSAKSRLGSPPETSKRASVTDDSSEKSEDKILKRMPSSVSLALRPPAAPGCSVGRVRPRPRRAPSHSLLLRAVADAHKSLLNIPPKVDQEPAKVKRALVLPMRRCVDAQKIVIQVAGNADGVGEKTSKVPSDVDKEEYIPTALSKKTSNSEYAPSRRERTSSRKDDTLIIETINIHNTTVDKDKETQFIVTMDGFNPNAFLAKKLMTEGILNDEEEMRDKIKAKSVLKTANNTERKEKNTEENKTETSPETTEEKPKVAQKKRSSDTSEDSDTQVIINKEYKGDKRKSENSLKPEEPIVKKRKASPIVFDVGTKEDGAKKRERERTEDASSDNHVVVTTTSNTHKYDSLPPLSAPAAATATASAVASGERLWCRSFPLCRFGATCAFAHPRCRFALACSRRACAYSHPPRPQPIAPQPQQLASHVVPSASFKSITTGAIPNVCKYYPNCVNPSCHYYHPKPCRYGKACVNKTECNFYHGADSVPKWQYPV